MCCAIDFTFVWFLTVLLMSSIIVLLTLPSSGFAGLINRHFGLLMKFPLWSLRVIKAVDFVRHSTFSEIPISSLRDLASLLILSYVV